ncbi:MAG: PIG-L family deacetylase [Vicinamibacterales bacterium]
MAIVAHPDDESLGFGGALARYAAEGYETSLVTATRGQGGRYFGHPPGHPEHPGRAALASQREEELKAAAAELGVRHQILLDYEDAQLDRADVDRVVGDLVREIRRLRPEVVLTFAPDGAYGHPDHIAISQFTAAAVVAAAYADYGAPGRLVEPPHVVSKLYYLAWTAAEWAAYQAAFKTLVVTVDGTVRQAVPWQDWSLTTVVDTTAWWPIVWRAVQRHQSQIGAYAVLATLEAEQHRALWGRQSFYRVFSLVNGGRRQETDLFEGLDARVTP